MSVLGRIKWLLRYILTLHHMSLVLRIHAHTKLQAHVCLIHTLSQAALQGLADSFADAAAAQAMMRQDLLASLHNTVQDRRDRTAQQVATHQALLDRQVHDT